MRPVRISAVTYLNSRPLVHGLASRRDQFALQFDVPSVCAARLHHGDVDLGLIPSIEYLARDDYRIVPGVAVASDGPVASVCLFSKCPVSAIRSVALDTSSRTSAALVRILCDRHFGIAPEYVAHPPDLDAMLARCDAALLIGDVALQLNDVDNLNGGAGAAGLDNLNMGASAVMLNTGACAVKLNTGASAVKLNKGASALEVIDLGQAWTTMTGLPFVWAFWVGREHALAGGHVAALQVARDAGVAAIDDIASAFTADVPAQRRAARYLRENIRFWLGAHEREGLRRYYHEAAALGLVEEAREPRFY